MSAHACIESAFADQRHALTPLTRSVRLDFTKSRAANLLDPAKLACLGNSFETKRTLPTSPKILFVLAANDPRDVEPPGVDTLCEPKRSQRYGDLYRKSFGVDASFRDPRSIPGDIDVTTFVRNQCVLLCPKRVNREAKSVAPIMISVQQNLDAIVVRKA